MRSVLGRKKASSNKSKGGKSSSSSGGNTSSSGGSSVNASAANSGRRTGGAVRTPHGVPLHKVESPTKKNRVQRENGDMRVVDDDEILTEAEIAAKRNQQQSTDPHAADFVDLPPRFQFKEYLGHGAYGQVCLGEDMENDRRKVAIKKVKNVFGNDIDAKRLLRELRILRRLGGHDQIVALEHICVPDNLDTFSHVTLVFEYVDTDLSKIIDTMQFFEALHVQYFMYQILLGVKYMHSANIVHRDLKPANILVNENCSLKICDFGLARGTTENEGSQPNLEFMNALQELSQDEAQQQQEKAEKRNKRAIRGGPTKHVVTRWYRSPEVTLMQQDRANLKAIDMWSVGCIMGELLQMRRENVPHPVDRRPLFPGEKSYLTNRDNFVWTQRKEQLNVIFDLIGTPSAEDIDKLPDANARTYLKSLPTKSPVALRTKFPAESDESLDLLKGMLQFSVDKRLTVDEALEHPYFASLREYNMERAHDPEVFEFEDVPVTLQALRALIIAEIAHYNPELRDIVNSSASS